MNSNISTAIILFLAGGVVTAAYFRSKAVKRINAPQESNTVNPQNVAVVQGQVAAAKGPLRSWNGPVDFTTGSDIVGGYGGSTRMESVVRYSDNTSPQYVNTAVK